MHVELMFPSNYVKAAELLGRSVVLTIATVKYDPVAMEGGKKEKKAVITFEGKTKAWIMNRTCAKVIRKAYGPETNDWIGKRIELYPTTCEAFGEIVDCIRVRVPGNGAAPAKAQKKSEKTAEQVMTERSAAMEKGDDQQTSMW